jgi:hypothetical protein
MKKPNRGPGTVQRGSASALSCVEATELPQERAELGELDPGTTDG